VSKRSKRRRGPQESGAEGAARGGRPAEPSEARQASRRDTRGRSAAGAPARRAASDWGLGVQLALLVVVFAVVVLIAELAGAANLGVALGVGQIAFAIAVIYLLIRR
jgi:hypothetical protein